MKKKLNRFEDGDFLKGGLNIESQVIYIICKILEENPSNVRHDSNIHSDLRLTPFYFKEILDRLEKTFAVNFPKEKFNFGNKDLDVGHFIMFLKEKKDKKAGEKSINIFKYLKGF